MEKKDLKPAGVFKYFEEICQVPRPSKKEEKMIAYLKAFGAKHNLETKVDEAGNVLIKKPATPGKENLQTASFCNRISTWCAKRITMFNTTSSC
jgi:dipeptidase D